MIKNILAAVGGVALVSLPVLVWAFWPFVQFFALVALNGGRL